MYIKTTLFIFLSIINLAPLISAQIMIDDTHEFTDSKFPIVFINTLGNTIHPDHRVEAQMGIIYHEDGTRHYIGESHNHYNGRIEIEYRGSSSRGYPKKQYRLETQNNDGSNNNVSLLGMPEENDWILYGPYNDQSLIRNVLMYELSNQIGQYAVRTAYCELVVDNNYEGLYILMEKIKRDKNRVDIAKLDADDVAGDSLTGGYILKIDKFEGENNGGFLSNLRQFYQFHYPKQNEIQPEQADYIQNSINEFEALMQSEDYNHRTRGYSTLIDVPSFVDHFILNELSKNVDAYRISAYLHKDRDDKGGKLKAGPIWDMNLSLGKAFFYMDLYVVEGWAVDYSINRPSDGMRVPFWWNQLENDYHFMHQVYNRWEELRATKLNLNTFYDTIDMHTANIEEARIRNFQRWPEVENNHDYETEIAMLKEWIELRFIWIDENLYDYASSIERPAHIPESLNIVTNYPNPFNPNTTIIYHLEQPSEVKCTVFNLEGKKIAVLFNGPQLAGINTIHWNGKNKNGMPASSGVYLYKIQTNKTTLTGRMNLAK